MYAANKASEVIYFFLHFEYEAAFCFSCLLPRQTSLPRDRGGQVVFGEISESVVTTNRLSNAIKHL